jgi:hypothetical protein
MQREEAPIKCESYYGAGGTQHEHLYNDECQLLHAVHGGDEESAA